jgi:hypothetical protein
MSANLLLHQTSVTFVSPGLELKGFEMHSPYSKSTNSVNCPPYWSELCATIAFGALVLPGKDQ